MKENKIETYLGCRVLWLNAIRRNDYEATLTYMNEMHRIMFSMSSEEFQQSNAEGEILDFYYDFPSGKR